MLHNNSNNNSTRITINETNIAWASDKQLKYKLPQDPNNPNNMTYYQSIQWINVTDEHFMVWMRPAGLPNFRKLWGRIPESLISGMTYNITITNSNYIDLITRL